MNSLRKSLMVFGLILIVTGAWGQTNGVWNYNLTPWEGIVFWGENYTNNRIGPVESIGLPCLSMTPGMYSVYLGGGYNDTNNNINSWSYAQITGPNGNISPWGRPGMMIWNDGGVGHLRFQYSPLYFNAAYQPYNPYSYNIHFYVTINLEMIPPYTVSGSTITWRSLNWNQTPAISLEILNNNTNLPYINNGNHVVKSIPIAPSLSVTNIITAEFDLPPGKYAIISPFRGTYSALCNYADHTDDSKPHYQEHTINDGKIKATNISIWYAEDKVAPIVSQAPQIPRGRPVPNYTDTYYTNEGNSPDNKAEITWQPVSDEGSTVHESASETTTSGIAEYYIYEKKSETECNQINSFSWLDFLLSKSIVFNIPMQVSLAEGKHELCMKARDVAGNPENLDEVGFSSPCTVIVDRTPPEKVNDLKLKLDDIGVTINSTDYTRNLSPYLTCSVPPDQLPTVVPEGGSIDNSSTNSNHYTIFFVGDPSPAPTTRTDEAIDSTPLPALENGTYKVAVRYYDNAGNIDTSPIVEDEYYTFRVDTVAPTAPGTITVKDIEGNDIQATNNFFQTTSDKVTLSWLALQDGTEEWQSGLSELKGYTFVKSYTVGGNSGWTEAESISNSFITSLSKGENIIRIRSMDNVGNESEYKQITIRKLDPLQSVTFPKNYSGLITFEDEAKKNPILHWNAPLVSESGVSFSYSVSILYNGDLRKSSGTSDITATQFSMPGLATKLTYIAVVIAKDSLDRTSTNSTQFTLGNIAVKIGPGGEYDVTGPAADPPYANAAALPQFGLTKSPPRHDGEGDLVLHKLFYKKQGSYEYLQLPQADGEYTAEPISLPGIPRGTYEWYMEIAEFYDPGSGAPNKFDSKQRWPVTTTETMSFTILDNTTTGGYSDVIITTPGKPVSFDAGTYLDLTGTNIRYDWDFGDGTVLNQDMEASKTHSFTMNPSKEWDVSIRPINGEGNTFGPVYIQVIVENTTRGALYADEDWSGDHPLYGSVTVPAGITLTIHAGTNVKAYGNGDTKLDIKGTLNVWGDDGAVHIGSESGTGDSDWQGIVISGRAEISHCTIENAKRGITCVNTVTGVSIGSTLFMHNLVGLHSFNATALVGSCRFENNTWYAIKEDNPTADRRPEVTKSVFAHNGYNYYHYKLKNISITKLNEINGLDATRQNKEGE